MDNIMTIADNLQTLINCKADMKSAIEEKGVTVSGGLSTYADAIREIVVEEELLPANLKFGYSTNLVNIPENFDTSNYTDMYGMFENCSSLTSIPQLDTSNVTNMGIMFYGCSSLTSIPQLDTSKVKNMGAMFSGCSSLTSIPLLNCGNVGKEETIFDTAVNSFVNVFVDCENLKYLSGFKDLGKYYIRDTISEFANERFYYSSIINVLNNLYDRAAAGEREYMTLKLRKQYLNGPGIIVRLSDEDIAIATNKGWSVEIIDY